MRLWCVWLGLLALGAVLAPASQAAPLDLLSNGSFDAGSDDWNLPDEATAPSSVVAVTGAPTAKALRISPHPVPGADPWSANLNHALDAPLDKGHHYRLKFWARSPQSLRLAGHLEVNTAPWDKLVSVVADLTPAWKSYQAEAAMDVAHEAGKVHLVFHLAYSQGVIEMTGVQLLDLDSDDAGGVGLPTLEHPQSLLSNGDFAAEGTAGWYASAGRVTMSRIEVQVAGQRHALRLDSTPVAGEAYWTAQFGQSLQQPVRRGDAIYARLWLRSPDRCTVTIIFELAAAPNTKSIDRTLKLTPDWQEYRFAGRADGSYAAGQSQFKLFLGHDQGEVDVAAVRLENYGRAQGHRFDQTLDYWGGREHPDTWRPGALDRIERLRKGDLTVKVVDAAGQPVPGARVHVEQLRHAFRFGSAVPARRLVDTTSPDNVRFQREVERLYNVVTFENDLKWHDLQPGEQAVIDQAIAWCEARGIAVRAHNLVWGSEQYTPQRLHGLAVEPLRAAVAQRVRETAARYRGHTYLWDVVNEAVTNTWLWDKIGWEQFAHTYQWAHAADPQAQLCYNEFGILTDNTGHRQKAAERIRYLLDHGAPVDVLGMQSHFGTPLVPMVRVKQLLDEWAAFGKALEVTEFDLGGVEDDAVHAAWVQDFMTLAFAEPRLQSFIMWGFWEGSHWRANEQAAMVRRDWTPRPAQAAWEDLVFHQWWTRLDGTTAADGGLATRVFYGRHKVTVEGGGKRAAATVSRDRQDPAVVTLTLR